MRLLRLRIEARAEAAAAVEAILDRAADDDGRELTADEEAELVELRAAIDRLDGQIEAHQADAARAARAADTPDPAPTGRTAPTASAAATVEVRSEPGTYDGPEGLRRMLVDMAVTQGVHHSPAPEYRAQQVADRVERYRRECDDSDRLEVRAISTSNLAGLVNPQFDPAMVSRGIYASGVTAGLLRRYPVFPAGDSITLPRVTTQATAGSQDGENTAFHLASIATTGVKADLVTIAVQAPISVQSVERGYMALELLADEIMRAWVAELNRQVLMGSGEDGQLRGLLADLAATKTNADQNFARVKANATAADALDALTAVKTAIWAADLRRPDAYIVSPALIGLLEAAKVASGEYLIPPWAGWARNVGGAGTIPESEGVQSELEWRRLPLYADSLMPDKVKADESAFTGGDQTRIVAMCRDEMPIFFDGPMSYSYEQTLAASGQLLLVARGYAAFNPLWRPSAWRVVTGTAMKLGL